VLIAAFLRDDSPPADTAEAYTCDDVSVPELAQGHEKRRMKPNTRYRHDNELHDDGDY
jgi:hypothetical protein